MPETDAIELFLQTYDDQAIVALLDHAEKGKLAYSSCCCIIGAKKAPHALQAAINFLHPHAQEFYHHQVERAEPLGAAAEDQFYRLGETDEERRERVIPIVHAEISRRANGAQSAVSILDRAKESVAA